MYEPSQPLRPAGQLPGAGGAVRRQPVLLRAVRAQGGRAAAGGAAGAAALPVPLPAALLLQAGGKPVQSSCDCSVPLSSACTLQLVPHIKGSLAWMLLCRKDQVQCARRLHAFSQTERGCGSCQPIACTSRVGPTWLQAKRMLCAYAHWSQLTTLQRMTRRP